MIQMALNGEGEPAPTLLQAATQAATIELFTQWQTYRNGVHLDWDTFRSINFRALAVAVLTGAGFEVRAVDAALQLPPLDDDLNVVMRPELTLAGTTTPRGAEKVAALVAESTRRSRETDAVMRRPHGEEVQA